jgi:hypothetical protein
MKLCVEVTLVPLQTNNLKLLLSSGHCRFLIQSAIINIIKVVYLLAVKVVTIMYMGQKWIWHWKTLRNLK